MLHSDVFNAFMCFRGWREQIDSINGAIYCLVEKNKM